MPLYECELCQYTTKIKTHFNRHINTPKHKRNYLNSKINNESTKPPHGTETDYVSVIKSSTQDPNDILIKTENTENKEEIQTIQITISDSSKKDNSISTKVYLNCEFCGRKLSTKGHLARHIKSYCPALKTKKESNLLKDMLEEQKQQFANERANLYKQIEKLLDKVGNTTNIQSNIKNTITLNSYGNENLSHITDNLKTSLLKLPYVMIPKLIEAVHFNDEHPENKNIALTNSRDNKIKIFSDNRWIYRDKEETINDLVEGKYYILDAHFEEVNSSLDSKNKTNFVKFKHYLNSEDKEFCSKLKRDCEMVLLNNR